MAVENVGECRVHYNKELGRGTYGTVYKGWNTSKTAVAAKRMSRGDKTTTSEVKALKKNITHDNIIRVYDVKASEDFVWIMMEFCNLGDLDRFFTQVREILSVQCKNRIDETDRERYAFLHKKDIVHRDIKPGNILVTSTAASMEQVIVKLTDFGLSKFLDPNGVKSAMSSAVGTMLFMAPDFWNRRPDEPVTYHRNVDVFAEGLTFTAMLQAQPGKKLFPKAEGSMTVSESMNPVGLVMNQRRYSDQPELNIVEYKTGDDAVTRELKELIRGMTCVNPEKRMSSLQVEQDLERIIRVSFENFWGCIQFPNENVFKN